MNRFIGLFFYGQLALTAHSECLKDSDCVLRPSSCCKCTQGGKLKAVAKNTPEPDCSDRMCVQVISKDKSCQAKKASCQRKKCELQF